MTGPRVGRRVPAGYRFRVNGHLDHHWSAWFGGLALMHHSDGTSSLSGPVGDQAELHGILSKIRDLGLTLIAVEVIDPPDNDRQAAVKETPWVAGAPGTAPTDPQHSEVVPRQEPEE